MEEDIPEEKFFIFHNFFTILRRILSVFTISSQILLSGKPINFSIPREFCQKSCLGFVKKSEMLPRKISRKPAEKPVKKYFFFTKSGRAMSGGKKNRKGSVGWLAGRPMSLVSFDVGCHNKQKRFNIHPTVLKFFFFRALVFYFIRKVDLR